MATEVGDTVHLLGWDTVKGSYVEEYRLVDITEDHIKLEHIDTYQCMSRQPGNNVVVQRPRCDLAYFEVPLSERIREQREFISWLCAQFCQP